MDRWSKRVLVGLVTGVLLGTALPAHAQQIPFDVVIPITGGVHVGIDASDRGSGFVGGCDPALRCTGASVRVANTEGAVDVGGVTVALVGSVCILDQAAPCGSAGDPGTGVVLTRREVVLEDSRVVIPAFEVELCVWQQAPRDLPTDCETFPIDPRDLTVETNRAELGPQLPERYVVSTGAVGG
jgi:hypothetical protein